MASAMVDFDSNFDSGFSPSPVTALPDPWLSDVREPQMLFGFGCMQPVVDVNNTLGYIAAMGQGCGYGASQIGTSFGYGDFVGILADDPMGTTGSLVSVPGFRPGAGAPWLENVGISFPPDCGALQATVVYPRDALTGVIAIGGPQGAAGSFTLTSGVVSGSGIVSGLAFQPNLLFMQNGQNGGFAAPCSMGFGACGPGLSQWAVSQNGVSFGSFEARSHAFCSTRIIDVYWDNSRVAEVTITGLTSDGFTYSWTRLGGLYDSSAWGIFWHAFRLDSGEVQVGTGEVDDTTISTTWEPEGIVYGSGNCPEGHHTAGLGPLLNTQIGGCFGGGVRVGGMQRVAAVGHGIGDEYNTGVIRMTSYTPTDPGGNSFATHTIGATGVTLSWSGDSNSKKFGYIAWGRSRITGRPTCRDLAQIYRLVEY